MGLIALGALLTLPSPLLTRFLVDDALIGRRLDLLFVAIGLLATLKLLTIALGPLRSYITARFEQDVILDLQEDLVERTLRLPKAFFDSTETGYLLSRLSADVHGLRWLFSGSAVAVATGLLQLLGGVGLLFVLEWRLGLATLVLLPALPFLTRWFGRRFRVLSLESMERHATLLRRLAETLSAATLVKAFGTERREARLVADELRRNRAIAMEQTVLGSASGTTINAIPDISRGVVLVMGAVSVIDGRWSLGSLIAFQHALGLVHGPVLSLSSLGLQLQASLAALDRVSSLYRAVPEAGLGTGLRAGRLRGEIAFDAVSFSYGREGVLEEVSFTIRPGETVVIAGPSGVGKTTLVSLLLLFYRPTSGEIRFDGVSVATYEPASLRGRIGYVSQNAILLSGNILDNLRYGNPDASTDRIVSAARAAGAASFIEELPQGYETHLGERGVKLSEGQRQRLSLARALCRDADVLVFDEPTAALDAASEQSILDALPELLSQRTCVVVSHRPATIARADRVIVLRDRKLVADAPPASLPAEEARLLGLIDWGE